MHIQTEPHQHIDNVRTYIAALNQVRALLFEAATKLPSDSQEQSQAFDAILALDFMIQSNTCVIDYINDLIKLNDKRAMDDLDGLVSGIRYDSDRDIHRFMKTLMWIIKTRGPQLTTSLETHYLLLKKNLKDSYIATLVGLCGPLAMILVLIVPIMTAVIIFSLLVAVSFLIVNWYSPRIANYQRLANAASLIAPSPFMYETETDYAREYKVSTCDKKTTSISSAKEIITKEIISKKELKTTLHHRFFNGPEKLSQQVETTYQSLRSANCI